MRLPDSIFQLEEFVMFLKKSLFFTTALALLMFAGQASSQSVSLTHVPGEGGTEGMAAGSGATITVKISQTGVNDIPGIAAAAAVDIDFAFDTSVVSLSSAPGLARIDTESGATLTALLEVLGSRIPVPPEATLTFTTVADVTDVEFSIGITGVSVVSVAGALSVPVTATVTFNEGGTGTPPGDGNGDGNGNGDNGDTGMPTPGEMSVSLTSGGESAVNQVGAGADVVVDVAVSGVTAAVAGGKITFSVDPSVATITGLMPDARVESESSGLNLVIAFPPMTLTDGNLGSVTFTTNDDYDGSTFSIGITSLELFTTGGVVSVAAGDPVMVNDFSPSLEADATEVEVPYGETATATVTAMDTEGEAVEFTVDPADAGTVSDDGNSVTVSATGNATVTVSATAGGVATNSITVVFTKAPPVLMTESADVVFEDFGAMASVSVTAAGFDEGAEINFTYEATADFQAMEDGSSLMITTGAPGTVTVSATDGTASASVTITFSNPDPYLTAS